MGSQPRAVAAKAVCPGRRQRASDFVLCVTYSAGLRQRSTPGMPFAAPRLTAGEDFQATATLGRVEINLPLLGVLVNSAEKPRARISRPQVT